MPAYYTNEEVLNIEGYEVYFTRYADSILKDHFQQAVQEITQVLGEFRIEVNQIVSGGGGLSTITQKLRDLLYVHHWDKENIESSFTIRAKVISSESHEVDHYKEFESGSIGLEIEWNNKDPFYDRDLENFRKLHQMGELSLGIIITRGASLQKELPNVYKKFVV